MAKAKSPKKTKAKAKAKKVKNLVFFVDNSTPRIANFSTAKEALEFANNFRDTQGNPNDGYWVDLVVSDIQGEVTLFDNVEIENN